MHTTNNTQVKGLTFYQPASAEAIRDLCSRHIGSLEELFDAQHLTTTPHCLWEEEAPAASGHLSFGASGKPRTLRECLTHDHRCRSATALFELACTCRRMADEISKTHRREIADLKKQLTSVKRCVVEWEMAFGSDYATTPKGVAAELNSLRLQLADAKKEIASLKVSKEAMQVQHNSLARFHEVHQSGGSIRRASSATARQVKATNSDKSIATMSTRQPVLARNIQ